MLTMRNSKTTGHLLKQCLIAIFLLVLGLAAQPASGINVALSTANDPISGNQREDDLYTASLGLAFDTGRFEVRLGERMFTDRQRALRFDETFLEAGRELEPIAGWQPDVSLGVLRVGEGFLGQDVQNEVHHWVGSDEVFLPYPTSDHWYGTARIAATRLFGSHPRLVWQARVELSTTPGFRSWGRAEVAANLELPAGLSLHLAAGGRTDYVESSLLGDTIPETGATFEAGLAWRHVFLRWTSNDFGTHTRHLALGVRFDLDVRRPARGW